MQRPEGIAALWPVVTRRFDGKPRASEPLANHTTSRLGGPADIWLPVATVEELVEAVRLARQYRVPIFMLGGGANILITDAGIRGVVIENRAKTVDLEPPRRGSNTRILTADSGVVLPNLARRCAREGLTGFEWAVGVPGTVGGAVVNNAGAYGSDMATNLLRAELLSPTDERLWQPVEWFDYDYRTSIIKQQAEAGWIVLRAALQLTTAPKPEVQARMTEFNERRKSSQPPGATMGSVFKNPPGDYAGRLIEAAGLKGYRVGQAQISPVHANFFKNLGRATSTEMIELIQTARQAVEEKFKVTLELEIEVVGE